jgi:TorA maturation chaperone TorD
VYTSGGTRALARSALWRLVADLFRPPDRRSNEQERLRNLQSWEIAARAARLLENPELARTLTGARQAFLQFSAEDLESVHDRVFGHTVRSAVPPYETEWGGTGGFLQPQCLADLAGSYRAHGLVLAPGAERHDHLAVECEYLYFLAYKEALALDRGEAERAGDCRAAAKGFLTEHLGRFAPAFAARLAREAPDAPYAPAGEFLRALVRSECAELGARSGEDDLPIRSVSFEEETECMRCTARLGAAPPA